MKKHLLASAALLALLPLHAQAEPAKPFNLQEILDHAVNYDPLLNSAGYLRYASKSDKDQACRRLWPQITLDAGYTDYDQDEAGSVLGDSGVNTNGGINGGQLSASATLSQTLWSMPKFVACRAGRIRANHDDVTYERAFEDFIGRTINAYMDLLAAQSRAHVASGKAKLETEEYTQAQKEFSNKTIAAWELDAAAAQSEAAAADKVTAENDVMEATMALEQIYGGKLSGETLLELREHIVVTSPTPLDPQHWIEVAEQNNLEIIESRLAKDISHEGVEAARAEMWPTADLFAKRTNYDNDLERQGAALSTDNGNFTTDALGVRVKWKFFTAGSTSAGVDAAKYRYKAAQAQHDGLVRKVQDNTRRSLGNVVASIASVRAKQTLLTSLRSYHGGIKKGQEVGTSTNAELLDAERKLLDAESQYNEARYAYIAAVVEFYKAIGALSADSVREINNWLIVPAAKSSLDKAEIGAETKVSADSFRAYVDHLLDNWHTIQWTVPHHVVTGD